MRSVLLSCILPAWLVFALGCGLSNPAEPDAFAERFKAAQKITDLNKKDDALAKIADDAADAGDVSNAKKALQSMTNLERRDAACHSSALKLAALGQRADAISIADLITNIQRKDETLSEIAKAGNDAAAPRK